MAVYAKIKVTNMGGKSWVYMAGIDFETIKKQIALEITRKKTQPYDAWPEESQKVLLMPGDHAEIESLTDDVSREEAEYYSAFANVVTRLIDNGRKTFFKLGETPIY